jgi:hypothetical protein
MFTRSLRYLTRTKGQVNEAIEMMLNTAQWREDRFGKINFPRPLTDSSILNDLKLGIVYISARDVCLRPLLVVRVGRIPSVWASSLEFGERLINLTVFHMEYLARFFQ